MPYCEYCKKFKEKITITKIGIWGGYCSEFKINRSIDNDICDRFIVNDTYEKVIIHRPVIKLEKLDDRFE